jgi:AraC-like DNA-binding protein
MSSLSVISTILFLGAAQGFLLSLVLFTLNRGNRSANKILAATLFLFSVNITIHTLSHTEFGYLIPNHSGIILVLFFLIAPLIYLYARILTDRDYHFRKFDLVHFVPFLLFAIVYIPFYLEPGQEEAIHRLSDTIGFIVITQAIVYIVITIKILFEHGKNIKDTFSHLEKINLNWLRMLIIGYIITWIFALAIEGHESGSDAWDYGWLMVSFFIYMIGYMGLRQPEIFTGIVHIPTITDSIVKYKKSTLSPERAKEFLQKLDEYMEKEKPFLRSDITLPEMANELSLPVHHLSQIINEKFKQNFFEFINRYRVEAAKVMLVDPKSQNLNIASLGFDAGFNSISAFNSAFKRHARTTPSAFRRENLPK